MLQRNQKCCKKQNNCTSIKQASKSKINVLIVNEQQNKTWIKNTHNEKTTANTETLQVQKSSRLVGALRGTAHGWETNRDRENKCLCSFEQDKKGSKLQLILHIFVFYIGITYWYFTMVVGIKCCYTMLWIDLCNLCLSLNRELNHRAPPQACSTSELAVFLSLQLFSGCVCFWFKFNLVNAAHLILVQFFCFLQCIFFPLQGVSDVASALDVRICFWMWSISEYYARLSICTSF